MSTTEMLELKRNCEASLVPSGSKITLQAGQQVVVTQSLGGSFTVVINGNMARIAGKDADALGKDLPAPTPPLMATPTGEPPAEQLIWDQLKTCYDPEIPVNIVELGLIYDLQTSPMPEPQPGYRVDIKMTLTAPGCGMWDVLKEDVQAKVMGIPGVEACHVELATEPAWNQSMMSEAAKLQLGML